MFLVFSYRHAALAKARLHSFYFGLDNFAWLEALVDMGEKKTLTLAEATAPMAIKEEKGRGRAASSRR
jgi:hypothetical protein